MTVEWRAEDGQLHLHNGRLSVVLAVHEDGSLGLLHLGGPLPPGRSYRHLGPDRFSGFDERVGEPIRMAFPTTGGGDFRVPALVARGPDGGTTLALRHRGHRVDPGKPALDGLPSTYVEVADEAVTLTITLADDPTGLEVDLRYTLFRDRPVVAHSAVVRATREALELETVMSLSLDLPDADWVLVELVGAWARETHVVERPLVHGRQGIASTRGASGAQANPFLALRRRTADEAQGEVLAASLVYSGNFLAEVEVDPYGTSRLRLGIEPETFAWRLEAGSSFTTPEALVAYSVTGVGGISDALHPLFRRRLARGPWRDRPRPVVLNTWEATYFDFDAERILAMARAAHELGVELLVLDDGWFGRRDADDRSLGDWVADRRKLPDGVPGLARAVNDVGLAFGIWVEPEMVSPDSDLFRAHPDWAIGVPGRRRTTSRHQLVLDLGRPEVVDHLTDVLGSLLDEASVSYVKWDMNRNITEPYSLALPPSRQGEFFHRYMLGLYELLGRLTERFPDVLFESCASGGGRFDPGLLAFAPQTWASDDTDAIERLAIQWGAAIPYPLSAIAAHVSAVPNHQTGRVTPIASRANVAFFGVLGYELDPLALDEAERAAVADQIAFYRRHRDVFQRGRFLRLAAPWDGSIVAWMVVASDEASAIVGVYCQRNRPSPERRRIRLRGLDAEGDYQVAAWPVADDRLARTNSGLRSGADLLANGLVLDQSPAEAAGLGDYWSRLFLLQRA